MSSPFSKIQLSCAALFGALSLGVSSAAPVYSPGIVTLTATLSDFTGSTSTTSGQRHDVVIWVTKADGTFIKTIYKQGPAAFDGRDWLDHFDSWNTARAGSVAFDGFTGATAQSYASPNNPISITWNCKDASNNLVEDGDYKFFIQYAESKNVTVGGVSVPEQGPTTSGLTWTKSASPLTVTPANEGTYGTPTNGNNFTNMSIAWTFATVPPSITSTAPPSNGAQGTPYNYTVTATGSDPITMSIGSGSLPTGLTITSAGVISGTPTVAGTFTGTIVASNGLIPNASQPFSITIAQAIVFTSATPPANGNIASTYTHSCTVIGTAPVTFSMGSGMLPPGLTLSSDGLISGTPTEIGTYSGTIKAHNGLAPDTTQDFSITVSLATPGSVTFTATISDYTGTTSTTAPYDHDALVWVTDANGKFIKTLWKQGKATFTATSKDWDHFAAWNTARNGSDAFDGYTSATATSYASPNNPLTVTWDCRDAAGKLVDDGNYQFFVQYGENQSVSGVPTQGPLSSALVWTKGLASSSVTPPNEGAVGSPVNGNNFTNMSIVWTSGGVYAPEIVVQEPLYTTLLDGSATKDFGDQLIDTTGTVKTFTIKNVGTTNLTGLGVYLYGTNAADFAVITPPAKSTLAPWESTNFTVVFKPTVTGNCSASMQIVSNDADESPFDIQLTGNGTPPPAPEIVVQQPVGSSLKSGFAKRKFGIVQTNSKGKKMTFTIKNKGTAPLTGLKVVKFGAVNLKPFIVSSLSTTSLAPGESTTFTVTFKPTDSSGLRRCLLRIRSNDSDESPFEIAISGYAQKSLTN